jgi:hypothetical protein
MSFDWYLSKSKMSLQAIYLDKKGQYQYDGR